jgi:hypothetical protein
MVMVQPAQMSMCVKVLGKHGFSGLGAVGGFSLSRCCRLASCVRGVLTISCGAV